MSHQQNRNNNALVWEELYSVNTTFLGYSLSLASARHNAAIAFNASAIAKPCMRAGGCFGETVVVISACSGCQGGSVSGERLEGGSLHEGGEEDGRAV